MFKNVDSLIRSLIILYYCIKNINYGLVFNTQFYLNKQFLKKHIF